VPTTGTATHSSTALADVPEMAINTYNGAVNDLKDDGWLPPECRRRPTNYLNNIVEQDHRCVKRQARAEMGYGSYPTARRTIRGIEADYMIWKGQITGVTKSDIIGQKQFTHRLFGLT
jgi:transposase-like protein